MVNRINILCIDQLIVMARIGIYDWEKRCLQKLIFDLKLKYTDILCISYERPFIYLDYTQIGCIIRDIVNTKHFLLIEEIAELVSKTIINRFSIVYQVQIRINKPGAMRDARNVGICIKRTKLNDLKKIQLYLGWK